MHVSTLKFDISKIFWEGAHRTTSPALPRPLLRSFSDYVLVSGSALDLGRFDPPKSFIGIHV